MSALSDTPGVAAATVEDAGGAYTRALYAQHRRRVYRQCLRILRSPHDAEDATQQTFVNALQALRGGTRPTFEVAWLLQIARNVSLERRAQTLRRADLEACTSPDLLDELPQDEGDEAASTILAALAQLEPRQRDALLLREWRGLSYREIGSALQLSQSAVEALIFRARRSLARALENGSRLRGGLSLANLLAALRGLLPSGAAKTAALAAGCGLTVLAVPVVEHAVHDGRPDRPVPLSAAAPVLRSAPAPAAAGVVTRPAAGHSPLATYRPRAGRAAAATPTPVLTTPRPGSTGAAGPADGRTPASDPPVPQPAAGGAASAGAPSTSPSSPATAPARSAPGATAPAASQTTVAASVDAGAVDAGVSVGIDPTAGTVAAGVDVQAPALDTSTSVQASAGDGGAGVSATASAPGGTTAGVSASVGPTGAAATVTLPVLGSTTVSLPLGHH